MMEFLAAPFVASLILTGIHAYLGVHVVERGVIFVDLSLAQIAALGAAIAILLPVSGGDPHAPDVYWISLGFTFIGAGVFSTIRGHRARIPQEAIIGICYAVASAAAILAMSKATSESEHLKDMLVGNILAVSWSEVGKTAALYGAIGVFHYIFRKKFLAISLDHDNAVAQGLSVRFWDFLFYASFGFVVTSSVGDRWRAAGVLLPDRSLGRGNVVCRHRRAAPRDWLDDGYDRVGAGGVSVARARPPDRGDHRVHVRCGARGDGSCASADSSNERSR
jgi:zinc/manganese transport system permease protein